MARITLTYEFATEAEVLEHLQRPAHPTIGMQQPGTLTGAANLQAMDNLASAVVAANPQASGVRGPGRPRKNTAAPQGPAEQQAEGAAGVAPVVGSGATPAPQVPAAQPAALKVPNQPVQAIQQAGAPTIDIVRAVLMKLMNVPNKGARAVTAILTQFGANRVSDIKPEQFAAVLDAAAKA